MGEPDTVVDINFFCSNNVCGVIVDLKDDITYIHHWGSMCYVLCNISVLVTILDEEEIWNDAVGFNIKFKFQSLPIQESYHIDFVDQRSYRMGN